MTALVRGRTLRALLARPAAFAFGITWIATTAGLAEYAGRSGSWALIALLPPIPTGVIAAQLLLEVQHTTFAWTLPRLGRSMFVPLGVMSLLWGAAIAAVATEAGSPGDATLAYAALTVLGFWFGTGLFDPLQGWRGAWTAAGTALVGLFAHVTLATGLMASAAVVVAAVAMAGWCVDRFLSRDVLRRRPSTPTLTFANSHLRDVVERYRLEKLAASPRRDPGAWRHALAGAPARVWGLAALYERNLFGSQGVKLLAGHCLFTGVGVLVFVSHPSSLSWETITGQMFRTLVTPAGSHHLGLAFVVTCLVCGPFGSVPIPRVGLAPSLTHPLSRAERARVVWLTQWLVTAVMALAAGMLLASLAWLAAATDGRPSPIERLPAVIPGLTFTLSTVPFLQWRAARAEWRSGPDGSPALWTVASIFLALAILAATVTLSVLSADLPSGASPAVQLVGWIGWLTGALLLHRWLVIRHFRSADLV